MQLITAVVDVYVNANVVDVEKARIQVVNVLYETELSILQDKRCSCFQRDESSFTLSSDSTRMVENCKQIESSSLEFSPRKRYIRQLPQRNILVELRFSCHC